jgi:GH15 family glucan-1,4-alpha-glucosidase
MDNLDYGVIGNCRSAALVASDASIDWCCLPDFNSSSAFGRLLDQEKGGFCRIEGETASRYSQAYLDNTNILRTVLETTEGSCEVLDFMPRYRTEQNSYHCPPDIIRLLRPLTGTPRLRIVYDPRLGYARHATATAVDHDCVKSETTEGVYDSLYLYSDLPHETFLEARPFTLKQECFLLISYNQKILPVDSKTVHLEYERTLVYWLNWVERTVSFRRYGAAITRSALVLKLLSVQKSGAIVAAATTSLPEVLGGERNWDYRFCWVRDASMTIDVFSKIGHQNVAMRFLNFIIDTIPWKRDKMQIMYGIRGERDLTEHELDWLAGYAGSRPVRIGNAAYTQQQNDTYGILIDIIHQYFRLFRANLDNGEELWTVVRSLAHSVEKSWRDVDMGIWEFRGMRRHFVFSKVLSWTAFDRAARIAALIGRSDYAEHWRALAEEVKADIHTNGWSETVGAFTQYYGSDATDAANLLMANYGFIEPHDPKFVATVLRTRDELCRDGLAYRYRTPDDFGESTTSFTICTFWLAKCLHLIGEQDEAKRIFEGVLAHANHLGLFSEGIDIRSKRLLGNFPQAYSHLALIDTAITLSDAQLTDEERLLRALREPQRAR